MTWDRIFTDNKYWLALEYVEYFTVLCSTACCMYRYGDDESASAGEVGAVDLPLSSCAVRLVPAQVLALVEIAVDSTCRNLAYQEDRTRIVEKTNSEYG